MNFENSNFFGLLQLSTVYDITCLLILFDHKKSTYRASTPQKIYFTSFTVIVAIFTLLHSLNQLSCEVVMFVISIHHIVGTIVYCNYLPRRNSVV